MLSPGQLEIRLEAPPLRPQIGHLCLEFIDAFAFKQTKALLAQSGLRRQNPTRMSQRLRSLHGAAQVAAVQMQGLRPIPDSQVSGQSPGLAQADVVQGHIDLTLKTQRAVPVGFTMPNQQELSHAVLQRAGRWAWRRRSTPADTKRSTSPPNKVISRTRVLDTHW